MVRLTYLVHGTTTDNERGLATGWLPGALSARGLEESRQLGALLATRTFDVVFTSDLQRAIDTATIAFGARHPIVHDPRLREIDYGDRNGQPAAFKDDAAAFIETPFPGGERYRDVEARMRDLCAFLNAAHDGQHLAVVAHQAPQLALDVILRGRTWPQAIAEDWRRRAAWQPGWEYELA
jgi:broad specificity phosphatase PhoE